MKIQGHCSEKREQLHGMYGAVIAIGMLSAPLVATADGYEYPIAVDRSPAVQEDVVTLGGDEPAPVIALEAAPTEAAPSASAALPPAAESAAPAVLPQALDSEQPRTGYTNGGTASAGIANSGRTLSVTISDDVVRGEYQQDRSFFGIEESRFGVGLLLSEERDIVLSGTAMLRTFPGLIPNVDLAIGSRLYLALLGEENDDIVGAALGVSGLYELPFDSFPLSIGANIFYAPDVLVFGASERIIDFSADAGLRLRDNLSAFVGFRILQFDMSPGSSTVEDGLHVGVTWHFDDSRSDDELL